MDYSYSFGRAQNLLNVTVTAPAGFTRELIHRNRLQFQVLLWWLQCRTTVQNWALFELFGNFRSNGNIPAAVWLPKGLFATETHSDCDCDF